MIIYIIAIVLISTVVGGAFLVFLKRSGKGIPKPAAIGHGLFGLSGFGLLVYHIFTGDYVPFFGMAATLLALAILGGLFLFINHMNKKPVSDKLISVHGLVAFVGVLIFLYGAFMAGNKAYAKLYNLEKEKIGYVCFLQKEKEVEISIKIKKLPPGVHAFHIHEKGDFTVPDFKAAGGHFNPFEREHGLENPKGPHAGDLPNIMVKEDGTYKGTVVTDKVTLIKGKVNSLLRPGGTSVVIHKMGDDHKSNPAGAAGPRIAGGIIR